MRGRTWHISLSMLSRQEHWVINSIIRYKHQSAEKDGVVDVGLNSKGLREFSDGSIKLIVWSRPDRLVDIQRPSYGRELLRKLGVLPSRTFRKTCPDPGAFP